MSKKLFGSMVIGLCVMAAVIYGAIQLRESNLRAQKDTVSRIETAVNAYGRILQPVSAVYARIHADDVGVTFLVCNAKPGKEGQIIAVTAYVPAPGLPVETSTRPPLESAKCTNPPEKGN